MTEDSFKKAPHTPPHLFRANAVYIITGAAYQKRPWIQSNTRKEQWLSAFRKAAEICGWSIIAWVVLNNHYHVIVRASEASAETLPKFTASYHKFTARQWNDEDNPRGRQVWWNYWDTCIRAEADYLARFNYVHWNPVKHGIVSRPEEYAFSSYRGYFAAQPQILQKLEAAYPFSSVKDVPDDF